MDHDQLSSAAERFFRSYFKHCTSPDEDSLFLYLNSLHSFNDKIRNIGAGDLFSSQNFVGLKALRNLFHHEAELLHDIKIIPTEGLPVIATKLAMVCLVEGALVERAARQKGERHPAQVLSAFKWYGTIVDIQPSVFNVAVDVFEKARSLSIELSSEAYIAFESSYRLEEEYGHAHRVTGDIHCLASDVDEVMRTIFHSYTPAHRK
jgi:hypothetical protein